MNQICHSDPMTEADLSAYRNSDCRVSSVMASGYWKKKGIAKFGRKAEKWQTECSHQDWDWSQTKEPNVTECPESKCKGQEKKGQSKQSKEYSLLQHLCKLPNRNTVSPLLHLGWAAWFQQFMSAWPCPMELSHLAPKNTWSYTKHRLKGYLPGCTEEDIKYSQLMLLTFLSFIYFLFYFSGS